MNRQDTYKMEKIKKEQDQIKRQRIMYVTTAFTVLGILILLVAISTDYWVILKIPGGIYRNSTQGFVFQHHSGLWRICRTEIDNRSVPIIQRKYYYCCHFYIVFHYFSFFKIYKQSYNIFSKNQKIASLPLGGST